MITLCFFFVQQHLVGISQSVGGPGRNGTSQWASSTLNVLHLKFTLWIYYRGFVVVFVATVRGRSGQGLFSAIIFKQETVDFQKFLWNINWFCAFPLFCFIWSICKAWSDQCSNQCWNIFWKVSCWLSEIEGFVEWFQLNILFFLGHLYILMNVSPSFFYILES